MPKKKNKIGRFEAIRLREQEQAEPIDFKRPKGLTVDEKIKWLDKNIPIVKQKIDEVKKPFDEKINQIKRQKMKASGLLEAEFLEMKTELSDLKFGIKKRKRNELRKKWKNKAPANEKEFKSWFKIVYEGTKWIRPIRTKAVKDIVVFGCIGFGKLKREEGQLKTYLAVKNGKSIGELQIVITRFIVNAVGYVKGVEIPFAKNGYNVLAPHGTWLKELELRTKRER